jgi:SAM-dependent methyltransferase
MHHHHKIRFPQDAQNLNQDQSFFYFVEHGKERKIRFHDYGEIYKVPGLYEQLFYDRLKCCSHTKVCDILQSTIEQSHVNFTELRVLDVGAGNGMVGERLKDLGVARIVGVDIEPEAAEAAGRDRPGVYDGYHVANLTAMTAEQKSDIEAWSLDCLVSVAALGFGDIPPDAFVKAFNLIKAEGWVAFNIKETFLDNSDKSGFSMAIRKMIFSEYLDLYHLERYRHRFSIDGKPLYYFAIAGRKNGDIPDGFIKSASRK